MNLVRFVVRTLRGVEPYTPPALWLCLKCGHSYVGDETPRSDCCTTTVRVEGPRPYNPVTDQESQP